MPARIPRLQIRDFLFVRVEGVVIDEHRVPFDGPGNVGADALRVRVHLPDLLHHVLRRIGQMNRVPQALAHLLVAVEPGQAAERRQQRLRLDQHVCAGAEHVVEPAHDLARQLEVRHLILPDRHVARVVHRDVGRLQQRISEEPDRREVLVLDVLLLLLVGRDALEPRHRHDHRQQQIQFGVLRHQRLDEERALLRVEPGADPVGDVLVRVGGQLARVREVARQRMPVGDEVEAVVLLLQRNPVAERSHEMSEMQPAGRPHA